MINLTQSNPITRLSHTPLQRASRQAPPALQFGSHEPTKVELGFFAGSALFLTMFNTLMNGFTLSDVEKAVQKQNLLQACQQILGDNAKDVWPEGIPESWKKECKVATGEAVEAGILSRRVESKQDALTDALVDKALGK
jgi:hypothetical protein